MPFPFTEGSIITAATPTTAEAWTPFREYEWDIATHDYVIRNGRINLVEGLPALKIWIYKALLAQRGHYRAYTWGYGNDLDTLVRTNQHVREVLVSEAKRLTEEALLTNPHIYSLSDFSASMYDSVMIVNFTAQTDSGEIEISV